MPTVLTIAGFDPSSGAGITADLMVFAAHGLFGTSCITALTVQSTVGVFATHTVEPEILTETLNRLTEDLPPAGIKIGMLADEATVASVAGFLSRIRKENPQTLVVLDPVLRSSSGRELLNPPGISNLRSKLLPLVDWVTPNVDELAALTGQSVDSKVSIVSAAYFLQTQLNKETNSTSRVNVIVTGGHKDPPDDLLLAAGSQPVWIPGHHIPSNSTHGTGCAFSSALLSRLVLGDSPHAAALAAKHYVAEAIRTAAPMGRGKGPLNLLWPLNSSK